MKYFLQHVPLNAAGYDSEGRYWGTSLPLYRYACTTNNEPFEYIRASSRKDAKDRVRSQVSLTDSDPRFFP